jgi:hypothetical protein
MNDHMTRDESGLPYKHIWKAKIPPKIKVFLWLIENEAMLTKDNMIKRNWQGDPTYCFCAQPEAIEHLFFGCAVMKVVWGVVAGCFGSNSIPSIFAQYWSWIRIALPGGEEVFTTGLAAICSACWKARNKACFEKILIRYPCDILCHACAFLLYWARLYAPDLFEVSLVYSQSLL